MILTQSYVISTNSLQFLTYLSYNFLKSANSQLSANPLADPLFRIGVCRMWLVTEACTEIVVFNAYK